MKCFDHLQICHCLLCTQYYLFLFSVWMFRNTLYKNNCWFKRNHFNKVTIFLFIKLLFFYDVNSCQGQIFKEVLFYLRVPLLCDRTQRGLALPQKPQSLTLAVLHFRNHQHRRTARLRNFLQRCFLNKCSCKVIFENNPLGHQSTSLTFCCHANQNYQKDHIWLRLCASCQQGLSVTSLSPMGPALALAL